MPPTTNTPVDWRTLPRKGADYRTSRLSIRITAAEYEAIQALAHELGITIADLVVMRTLRKKTRR